VSAQGSGAIWTTNNSCGDPQNVNHYAKGDAVYINGDNFDPEDYDWTITGQPGNASDDPKVVVASGTFTVDESGSFCFHAYTVQDDDGGEYTVDFGNKNDNYRVDRDAASVLINVGTCMWSETEQESSTDVAITIVGAELTIDGMPKTYTSSTTINLPPGTYTYSWEALPGYTGSGSGSFTVIDCEPESASASVNTGACSWNETDGSLTPVTITLFNASLTINSVTYPESTTIDLPPGTYPYTWTANTGYQGSGSGSITVYDCSPGSAYASVETGACVWTEQDGSLTPVTITVSNASLTIDGETYTESTTINLAPGTYPYTWEAAPNYRGEGSGEITVKDCTPESGSASVEVGACVWTEQDGSLTPVTITVSNASLSIDGVTYTESNTINLAPGTYPYTWEANEDFQGGGSGSITVYDCSPDSGYANVQVGACVWSSQGGSKTPVTITISNASLTINNVTYTESTTIQLSPGTYAYSWEADPDYQGEGSGQITIHSCEPDAPAGGSGPSIISTIAIPMTGVSGLGIAWYILKKFFKKLG
jgi:hypothetical protein